MGVWIETIRIGVCEQDEASHPVWVCGLKQSYPCILPEQHQVTPCMGVWIETKVLSYRSTKVPVTPCMGVWIETAEARRQVRGRRSHPVWVCGLKLDSAA